MPRFLSLASLPRTTAAVLTAGGLILTGAACSTPDTTAANSSTAPAAASSSAASTGSKTVLSGKAVGTFAMSGCPAGAKARAMCASDTWASTTFDGPGTVTATFDVEFDQPSFQKTCAEVHKTGTIKVDDANTVTIRGDGFSCQDAGNIVTYTYQITGGTGRFANATGTGLWLVPPPTSMDQKGGVGPEILYGTLQL